MMLTTASTRLALCHDFCYRCAPQKLRQALRARAAQVKQMLGGAAILP